MELLKKEKYYGNVMLFDPNGTALNTVGDKKANWYLKKGLGIKVEGGVKLLFEPESRGNSDFLRQEKANSCFCCGANPPLTLHHVVPTVVRRVFKSKEHQHAWCVLLCEGCNEMAEVVCRQIYSRDLLKYVQSKQQSPDKLNKFQRLVHSPDWLKIPVEARNLKLKKYGYSSEAEVPEIKLAVKNEYSVETIDWAQNFVIKSGGEESLKTEFRNAFLSLEPKFLQKGYLEDHS